MKRFILPLILVAIMVSMVGAVGVMVVVYAIELANQPRPFSYQEMEDLLEKENIEGTAIPRLLAGFERNDADIQLKAAEALAKMGAKAIEPVREKLKSKNARVRFCAAQTFAFMDPKDAAAAAPDLIGALSNDGEADVRRKAAYALGRIGVNADGVVDALRKALNDTDINVVQEARAALDRAEKK